ncbi:hypothetical protein JCM11251_002726 [Rhodosporidiobolus azoricus]
MPFEGGIPPEVVDDILEYLGPDRQTLLSCCRASKGFSARVVPLLYQDLEILYLSETRAVGRKYFTEYHLSRSSAVLLDALYVNPSLGKYCAKLTIKVRRKELEDMVRLRTAPTVEALTELFERLPYVEEFVAPSSHDRQGRYNALNSAIGGAMPALGGPTKSLRQLKMARLDDSSFLPLLQFPNLVHLEVGEAKTKYPPPADPLPPFHLQTLIFDTADEALFAYGTSNSHDSLVHLSTPYSFPLSSLGQPFRNLRSLTITFSQYASHDPTKRLRTLDALKLYLSRNVTLRTLTFSHPDETPRSGRCTLLESLPPNLNALLLDPFELSWFPAARHYVPNWPRSLKKVRWTACLYGEDWADTGKEEVEEVCRRRGIETVEFLSAADLTGGTQA